MSRRKNKKQNVNTRSTHIIDLSPDVAAAPNSLAPAALSVSRPSARPASPLTATESEAAEESANPAVDVVEDSLPEAVPALSAAAIFSKTTTTPQAAPVAAEVVPAMQSSDAAAEVEGEAVMVEQADVAIKRGGEKFYDYYAQYRNLRDIARTINGLPQSAPFPRQMSIQKITIDFTLDGEAKTAESAEPKKVGDIAPLISFAIRDVIEKMNNELHVLSYLVTGMRNSVQTAFNSRAMAPPPGNYDNTNTQQ